MLTFIYHIVASTTVHVEETFAASQGVADKSGSRCTGKLGQAVQVVASTAFHRKVISAGCGCNSNGYNAIVGSFGGCADEGTVANGDIVSIIIFVGVIRGT